MKLWKLSAGTACVLGKKQVKTDVLPTTAYIMLGSKCRNNCKFCTQAQSSSASSGQLSRVTWPEVESVAAAEAIGLAFQQGKLKRACLQVVHNEESWATSMAALAALKEKSEIPICVSSAIDTLAEARELINKGAERICFALDAATEDIFRQVKGGNWERRWQLLSSLAANLPGRISTHLIVGLGETEEEMISTIDKCIQQDITVGLFAFTPVRGTAWADRQPPPLEQYRRVQIASYLLKKGYKSEIFQYEKGQLSAVAMPVQMLNAVLQEGTAFMTSGCPDCNRPYYNERPGKIMYNYPRQLTALEVKQAITDSNIFSVKNKKAVNTIQAIERGELNCEVAGY